MNKQKQSNWKSNKQQPKKQMLYIYMHGWVRRRHVSEKHRHPGPIGATLIMRLEGIPKLFWKNNAILQPKHELAW